MSLFNFRVRADLDDLEELLRDVAAALGAVPKCSLYVAAEIHYSHRQHISAIHLTTIPSRLQA